MANDDWMEQTGAGSRTSAYTAKPKKRTPRKKRTPSGYNLLGGVTAAVARDLKKGLARK